MGSIDITHIQPEMPVVTSDEVHFASVMCVVDGWLRLNADHMGQTHFIPLSWVTAVDDRVHVNRPRKVALQDWSRQLEQPASAR